MLTTIFGCIEKVVNGKNFPRNFCDLRMAIEDLLRPSLKAIDKSMNRMTFLIKKDQKSEKIEKSKTSKMWVDCLVRPVLPMMICVHA